MLDKVVTIVYGDSTVQRGLRCTCQSILTRLHHYFSQLGSFHLVILLKLFLTTGSLYPVKW